MVDIKQEFERLKKLPHKDIFITMQDDERGRKIELINTYKQKLKETDYKAIKYAEGLISETDYAPIRLLRNSYRQEINSLEQQLKG